jgi:predicted dehydrogenase
MGCTVIGQLKACPDVDGIVAYDIVPARVKRAVETYRVTGTTRLEDVMDDPEVKLVFVTAANDAHKPLVMAAFAAGKAVMCEKPIATNLDDAEEMVAESERLGLFFQIGFELRYSKLYVKVKEWIDAGLLGDVVNTQCSYICSEFHGKGSWRNVADLGGSMFGEKLSHYVDLPRWWIGSHVEDVFVACAPNVVPYYQVRDNYHAIYRFANGAVSSLTFVMYVGETFDGDPLQNVIDQQKDDGHQLTYLVVGTRGAAATDVFNRSIRRWEFGDSPACLTSKIAERLTWDPREDGTYFHDSATQNLDIVRRVAAGLPPMTPARDALATMRLCFAAEESANARCSVRLSEPAPAWNGASLSQRLGTASPSKDSPFPQMEGEPVASRLGAHPKPGSSKRHSPLSAAGIQVHERHAR